MLSTEAWLSWNFLFQFTISQFSSVIALGSDDIPISPGSKILLRRAPSKLLNIVKTSQFAELTVQTGHAVVAILTSKNLRIRYSSVTYFV